jgi:hypothetical protein
MVVKAIKKPLPTDENKRRGFLADSFFNRLEEMKFNGYTTKNWPSDFTALRHRF